MKIVLHRTVFIVLLSYCYCSNEEIILKELSAIRQTIHDLHNGDEFKLQLTNVLQDLSTIIHSFQTCQCGEVIRENEKFQQFINESMFAIHEKLSSQDELIRELLNKTNNECEEVTEAVGIQTTESSIYDSIYLVPDIRGRKTKAGEFRLNNSYSSIWGSGYNGAVQVGGDEDCSVAVVSSVGRILYSHRIVMSKGEVHGGLWLEKNVFALIIDEWWPVQLKETSRLVFISSDPDSTPTMDMIDYLPISVSPCHIASVNSTHFVVMSITDDQTNPDPNPDAIVTLHDRQNIYGFVKVTTLSYSGVSKKDSICLGYDDIWVVSYNNGVVHRFNMQGELQYSIGTYSRSSPIVPGGLYDPRGVHLDDAGGLLVSCSNGVIHRYHEEENGIGEWEIVAEFDKYLTDVYFAEDGRIYTVIGSTMNVYQMLN